MGINTVVNYWRSHNSCSTGPVVVDMPDIYTFDNSTVQEITYSNGNNNTMVRHYRVDGGGHDWFGAWGNRDIIASEIIWEFFSMYDLNGLIN
jgi:polyhydroxybutyrate depolymerase